MGEGNFLLAFSTGWRDEPWLSSGKRLQNNRELVFSLLLAWTQISHQAQHLTVVSKIGQLGEKNSQHSQRKSHHLNSRKSPTPINRLEHGHTLLGDPPCLHHSQDPWVPSDLTDVFWWSPDAQGHSLQHTPFSSSSLEKRPRRISILFLLRLRSSFWSRSIPTALCTQVLSSTVVSRISPCPGKRGHSPSECPSCPQHTPLVRFTVLPQRGLLPGIPASLISGCNSQCFCCQEQDATSVALSDTAFVLRQDSCRGKIQHFKEQSRNKHSDQGKSALPGKCYMSLVLGTSS